MAALSAIPNTDTAADAPVTACLNCGTALTGPYCPTCGQDARVRRLTLRKLLHDAPHPLFRPDRGIRPTLTGLLLRPGKTINGYLDGQRIRYMNPLAFVLLMAAAAVALYALDPVPVVEATGRVTAEEAAELQTIYQFTLKYYAANVLLNLPLQAAFNRLFFRRRGRNYAEHLAISAFVQGVLTLLWALLFALVVQLGGAPVNVALPVLTLVICAYLFVATYAVFAHGGARWMTLLLTAGSMVCYLTAANGLYSALFFLAR